jgi:hypothetical protein
MVLVRGDSWLAVLPVRDSRHGQRVVMGIAEHARR